MSGNAQRPDTPGLRAGNPFDKSIAAAVAMAKPHLSVGIVEKPLPGGTSLTSLQRRSTGSSGPPLRLWVHQSGEGEFYVSAGQVDSMNVRFGSSSGDELNDADPQTFTATNERVWLVLEMTLHFDQGWFNGGTLNGVYVDHGATVPTDDLVNGFLYKEIGRIINGAVTNNNEGYNLYLMMRDNSTLTTPGVVWALGRVS